jgi:hypothetical protein
MLRWGRKILRPHPYPGTRAPPPISFILPPDDEQIRPGSYRFLKESKRVTGSAISLRLEHYSVLSISQSYTKYFRMKLRFLPLLLLVVLFVVPQDGEAQRRRKSKQEEIWPPERAYGRTTLGNALQSVFSRHYDFCGFTKASGKRDYTPPTIDRFLGRRTLRTRVEKANINGGNLLSYIFNGPETEVPLDLVQYRADNLLFNEAEGINLVPQPREGFDAFLLTKNCSGYLKACLDAGINPPYAAFAAALNTDAQRNSTVVAMAGSFVSPLAEILAANDARTTELMAQLWRFYQDNPEYAGAAYYITQFEGVLVKHLTDAEEVSRAEQNLGVNVALPLAAKINANLTRGKTGSSTFSGTDWETIVFADFEGPYQRDRMFARLPSPQEIANYFRSNPVAISSGLPIPPLREGGAHEHSVEVAGLPAGLAGAGWQLENVRGNAFRAKPNLNVAATTEGLRFTLNGQSAPDLFLAELPGAIEAVPMYYELSLPAREGMPSLNIPVRQRLLTSSHPLVDMAGTRFELNRKNNGQFAFQWYITLNVTDRENPLDDLGAINLKSLQAGYADAPLDLKLLEASYDQRRETIYLVLESERTWPLKNIDDRNMLTYPLSMELALPIRDGFSACIRKVEARLAVPRIRVDNVPFLPGTKGG